MSRGRQQHHRKSAGFTLIEVLVTMGLMAIVLPVVARGMSVAMQAASHARHIAEASTLAENKLHELMVSSDPTTVGMSGDFGQDWQGYTWSMQSRYEADLLVTVYTLTVNWSERGQPRSFVISTMVADPYPQTT